jgi:hypothetical protein
LFYSLWHSGAVPRRTCLSAHPAELSAAALVARCKQEMLYQGDRKSGGVAQRGMKLRNTCFAENTAGY